MEITASAPGKLFLLGEYAVTSGHPAVVCSTRRRLGCKITATAGTGQIQIVRSDGQSWTCAHHLESVEQVPQAFRFAAAAAVVGCRGLGLESRDLRIELADTLDQGTPKVGLGGSAAVTAAIIAGLSTVSRGHNAAENQQETLHRIVLGIQAHRLAQGGGSGADVAAITVGGLACVDGIGNDPAPTTITQACHARLDEIRVDRLVLPPDTHLVALATGRPARSGPRASRFRESIGGRGPLGDHGTDALLTWSRAMSEASLSFRSACLAGDALAAQSALQKGGLLFRRLPALSGIPVWSPELRRLDAACRGQTTLALKPSGAGGGDCAIALVRAPGVPFWQNNPVIKSFASVELSVTGAGACAEVEKQA